MTAIRTSRQRRGSARWKGSTASEAAAPRAADEALETALRLDPNCFDINTSIQRCLVKAIALHGLGLSIYAGEDLPDLNEGADPPKVPPTEEAARPKVSELPPRKPASAEWLTEAQLRFIKKLIAETHTDAHELLAYFGFDTLDTIPKAEATRVIRALESKRRAA